MKNNICIFVLIFMALTSCKKRVKGNWVSLNNKESIDGYTRIDNSIFGGEIACNVNPLKNIDINTFEVLAGTKYAKDKNYVYYPLIISCVDYKDCGVCYYEKIIIEGLILRNSSI